MSSDTPLNIITQSSRRAYQSCPKAYWFRYILELIPMKSDIIALVFGTLIHACLDIWHAGQFADAESENRMQLVYHTIDQNYPERFGDAHQKQQWHYATAMMCAYMKKYEWEEGWEGIETEKFVSGPVVNPQTGSRSRSHVYAAKLDGDIYKGQLGRRTLLEHKTVGASSFGGDYIERLWEDNQLTGYAHYLEQQDHVQVNEAIYNILVKPMLEQRQGETEEQYQARYAEACASSKNGKSSAKRKLPETDDEFQERLAAWYAERPDRLSRQEIIIDHSQKSEILQELWNTTQAMNWSRRTGMWLRNRNNCYAYGRRCGYFECCAAKGEDELNQFIEMYLTAKAPHEEIKEFITEI